jgi:hypothetical protein
MVYKNLIYPGRPTFQSNNESTNARDYITKKTISTTFCNPKCPSSKLVGSSYQNLYNLRSSTRIKKEAILPTFNTTDLNVNLFTKMNLEGVTVIGSNGVIDPSGVLFGNTECGINNFENFLVPYVCPISNS